MTHQLRKSRFLCTRRNKKIPQSVLPSPNLSCNQQPSASKERKKTENKKTLGARSIHQREENKSFLTLTNNQKKPKSMVLPDTSHTTTVTYTSKHEDHKYMTPHMTQRQQAEGRGVCILETNWFMEA